MNSELNAYNEQGTLPEVLRSFSHLILKVNWAVDVIPTFQQRTVERGKLGETCLLLTSDGARV